MANDKNNAFETEELENEQTVEEQTETIAGEAEETAAEETAAEETAGEDNAAEEAQVVDEDTTLFGKKAKDPRDEKIAELTERLQRQMAEFDNFRKRTDKEKATMYDMGAGDVLAKMLDVVDNFERGLAGANEEDPFVQGMSKIYKQMSKVMEDLGVKAIEAEGKEFDPNLHNAVMREDNPDVGENIVTAELQKGYTYKESVLRHSMVKVANP